MAWLLFIDESGIDRKASPYEVLAGVAVQDQVIWDLIKELNAAEVRTFGRRYSGGEHELKAKKVLKKKVFDLSQLNAAVGFDERAQLAKESLDDGSKNGSVRHLKALAQAKLAYVTDALTICSKRGCRVFASMVERDAPDTSSDGLRKDYAYLFERFFYFLEDRREETGIPEQGIIVFDELEKSRSHVLVDQAHRYFKDTATGRFRSSLIIPEPFFVHSDLTTGIQLADLVAYTLSWGFRLANQKQPKRDELSAYAAQVAGMRYRAVRDINGNAKFEIWSVAHITDLRTTDEK